MSKVRFLSSITVRRLREFSKYNFLNSRSSKVEDFPTKFAQHYSRRGEPKFLPPATCLIEQTNKRANNEQIKHRASERVVI